MYEDRSYLRSLIKACEDAQYTLLCANSYNPKAIIIGDYHPYGINWFTDNIETILSALIENNDSILMEGEEGRILYDCFQYGDSPIMNIKEILKAKNITSYFDDDYKLTVQHRSILKSLQESYDNNDELTNRVMAEENRKLMELRNNEFINGLFGIKNQPKRAYQIVGAAHLTGLFEKLEKEEISYAIIVPQNIPDESAIQQYIASIQDLTSGSITKRLHAMDFIGNLRLRDSFEAVVLNTYHFNPKIRRHAVKLIGRIRHYKVFDVLLEKINDLDPLTRWFAAQHLKKYDRSEISSIINNYTTTDEHEKWITAAVLCDGKNKYQQFFIQGLQRKDAFIRSLSINVLSQMSDFNYLALEHFLDDNSPAVREEAIRKLIIEEPQLLQKRAWSKESDLFIRRYVDQHFSHVPLKSKYDHDKIKGSLIGVFIGDALGAPIEGWPLKTVKKKYGEVIKYYPQKYRGSTIRQAGSYTDDGELTLKILETISKHSIIDPYAISVNFSSIGKAIDEDPSQNIGYGRMTLMAFRRINAGVNWRYSGNISSGCGAAMRVAAIVPFSDQLKLDVEAQSIITHNCIHAIAGAYVVAKAIEQAYNISGAIDKDKFMDTLIEASRSSINLHEELKKLKEHLNDTPEQYLEQMPLTKQHTASGIGKGTLGVVPAAIYSFLRSPEDFKQTVITAINTSGDSDSIGAIAGAISGAYNGYKSIPREYIEGLNEHEQILKTIDVTLK